MTKLDQPLSQPVANRIWLSDYLDAAQAAIAARRPVMTAAAAEQRGREAERAEIVAWLRDMLHDFPSAYAEEIADAIEAHQHGVYPK